MKSARNNQPPTLEALSKRPKPALPVDDHNNHVLPSSHDDLESPLCDDCRLILAKFPNAQADKPNGNEPFHTTTKTKVEAQAASGCDLCRWFLKYGHLQENEDLVCTRQIEKDLDEQALWLGGGHALLTKKLTISELSDGDVDLSHSLETILTRC